MVSRRVMAVLLAAPLLVTAACGNTVRQLPNKERALAVSLPPVQATINPAPPSSAAPSTPAASSSSTAASSPAASSGPAPVSDPGGGTEVKALGTSKFAPDTLQVKVGTEVTFLDQEGYHSVTGGDGAPDASSPIGNNTLAAAGASVKVKFDKPGTYPFFCIPHQSLGMKGQIVVS